MSVLGNAKSNRHRKAHEVESGDAGRQSWHLTRGDLRDESRGGVSRGHSSEEAPVVGVERRAEEPRNRPFRKPSEENEQHSETDGRCNYGSHPAGGGAECWWIPTRSATVGYEESSERLRKRRC